MSNAKKPKKKTFSLDRYRSEVKGEPFELWISDDEKIVIPRPTGDQLFEAEEAFRTGSSRDVILAFCGDRSQELLDAVGGEDAQVMLSVAEDMQEHFQLGETPASRR